LKNFLKQRLIEIFRRFLFFFSPPPTDLNTSWPCSLEGHTFIELIQFGQLYSSMPSFVENFRNSVQVCAKQSNDSQDAISLDEKQRRKALTLGKNARTIGDIKIKGSSQLVLLLTPSELYKSICVAETLTACLHSCRWAQRSSSAASRRVYRKPRRVYRKPNRSRARRTQSPPASVLTTW